MTSLPVPDSPCSRTVASVGATNVARLIASAQPDECPTTRSCESWSDTATSRDLIESTALMAHLLATTIEPEDNEHESQYETGDGCCGLHGGAFQSLSFRQRTMRCPLPLVWASGVP